MAAKHTPTPWAVETDDHGGVHVVGACGKHFVFLMPWALDEERANADLTVRAVNAHDDLVNALKQAQSSLADMVSPDAIQNSSVQHAWAHAVAAEAVARAALAKAEA